MKSKAQQFIEANAKSPVVAAYAHPGGGGCYTLQNGKRFDLTLTDMQQLGTHKPRWHLPIDSNEKGAH